MNELFIFILFTIYYEQSNYCSYVGLVKEKNTEAAVRRCSTKHVLLKIFAKFIGKHLCRRLVFNKRF